MQSQPPSLTAALPSRPVIRSSGAVRLMAILDLLLALGILGLLARDLVLGGLAVFTQVEGGAVAAVLAAGGVLVLPALLLVRVALGLWRLERWAWVAQVAVGLLTIPLGVGALVFLPLLFRRKTRWAFGIGPDVVLAEIDAADRISLADLAAHHQVDQHTILSLLEQAIAAGSFSGALDRPQGLVYSAESVRTGESLHRCLRCGGVTESIGRLANCGYCGTAFVGPGSPELPMPLPVGLEVLRVLDRILAYWFGLLAVLWPLIFASYDHTHTSSRDLLFGYTFLLCLPLGLALLYHLTAPEVAKGQPRAWLIQSLLLPLAWPYLMRSRIRILFGKGLDLLRQHLETEGSLPLRRLEALLRLRPRTGDELAIYLVGTRRLEGILDWKGQQLLHPRQLRSGGQDQCPRCGAPFRPGGWCGYCGNRKLEEGGESPTPAATVVSPHPPAPSSTRHILAVCLVVLPIFPYILKQLPEAPPEKPAVIQPAGPPARFPVTALEAPFEGVAGYQAEVGETLQGPGIQALYFTAEGQLLSGEGNGLFVWDLARQARISRTPKGWVYSGIRWIGPDLEAGKLLLKPYHTALLGVEEPTWKVTRRFDLEPHYKAEKNALFVEAVRRPDGTVVALFENRESLQVYSLHDGKRLTSIPHSGGYFTRVCLDARGERVLALPIGEALKAAVWQVSDGASLLQWTDEGVGIFGVSLDDAGFSPSGMVLATKFRTLLEVDVTKREISRELPVEGIHGPLAFSKTGQRLLVGASAGPELDAPEGMALIDVEGWKVLQRWDDLPARATALALSPDGRWAVAGDGKGKVSFRAIGP